MLYSHYEPNCGGADGDAARKGYADAIQYSGGFVVRKNHRFLCTRRGLDGATVGGEALVMGVASIGFAEEGFLLGVASS